MMMSMVVVMMVVLVVVMVARVRTTAEVNAMTKASKKVKAKVRMVDYDRGVQVVSTKTVMRSGCCHCMHLVMVVNISLLI